MAKLTIGLPVYNGAGSVERALRSLLAQSFSDFKIVVSDNASTDMTTEIVQRMAAEDSRIRLVRQPRNLGAVANFILLADQADTAFFMWAAADDFWSSNYLAASMAALDANADAGFASGGFANVDYDGEVLRRMQVFDMLEDRSASLRLLRYTMLREASGKANIIYSVFRTPLLQGMLPEAAATFSEWGGDMGFIAGALSRSRYIQDERASLFKQISSDAERYAPDVKKTGYSQIEFGGAFPPRILGQFTRTMTRGISERQAQLVKLILRLRVLLVYGWQIRQKLRNLRRRLQRLTALKHR